LVVVVLMTSMVGLAMTGWSVELVPIECSDGLATTPL
jgi:hypothetical protein